jgi:hypothetical protein
VTSPLPRTRENLLYGSMWTILTFAATVSIVPGILSFSVLFVGFPIAMVIAASISAVATVLIGAPLAWLVEYVLRSNSSEVAHLIGAFASGVTTALAVTAIAYVVHPATETVLYGCALAAFAGPSATAGWLQALHAHQRRLAVATSTVAQ